MSTVFTDDYAAYLFILLAIVMLICGFIFAAKGGKWLFWLSSFGWAMAAFYAFSVQTTLASFVHFLGFFEVLAAFGTAFMPMILRDKKPPPVIAKSMTSEEYTEMLRAMRYGKRAGYDKSGNKAQGW